MGYAKSMGVNRLILNVPAIYKMYQAGWSLRALSKLLIVSGTAIKARFDQEGMPLERYHRKVGLRQLAELHHQGLSQAQMAQRLHVSRTAVFRAMERLRALYPEHAPIKRLTGRWHAKPQEQTACKTEDSLPLGVALGCAAGMGRLMTGLEL